ncbi:MAG: hypothetical protein HY283_01910 [Nitrospirae bacterium]|nr:hypothetical protein [Nitrospirota bacterium]
MDDTNPGVSPNKLLYYWRVLSARWPFLLGLVVEHNIPRHPTTIFDYWRIILRYRGMIAVLVVGSVLITGVASKMSPKLYEAKATFFPAKEGSGGSMSFGGEKDKGGGGGASMALEAIGGSQSGPNVMETLHALLMSRVMAESVATQLNLMEYYGTTSLAQAVNAVRGQTDIRPSPFKSFEITVLDRDPKMAAAIANAFAENLDRLNKEINITGAKRSRLFIEKRLEGKTKKLMETEEALRIFQTEHRALAPKEMQGAVMDQVAQLHGEIVAKEVELAALKEYATPSHPQINQLQVLIQELRRQLDKLEQEQGTAIEGKPRKRQPLSRKAFPFFSEAPALAMEYIRLTRQMKVEEAVYGMLVGMLEQAKIAEVRDGPTIQALDRAIPPEVHSRPRSLENVQIAAVLSLIFGILLAFFLNYLEQIKAQEMMQGLPVNGGDGLPLDPNGNGSKLEGHPMATIKKRERLHQGP